MKRMAARSTAWDSVGIAVNLLLRGFAILCMCGAGLHSAAAQAIDATTAPPGLDILVHDANRIAVVRAVSHKELHDLSDPSQPECGYLITASVIEALKGGKTPFQFFAPRNDFGNRDDTYFVMVFSKSGANPTELMLPIDRHRHDLVAEEHCQAFYELSTPIQIQTIWRFDEASSKLVGGEWLAGASRTDGLLCGFRLDFAKKFRTRSVTGIRIKFVGSSGYVTNWSDVQSTIGKLLGSRDSMIGCGMDSGREAP